MKHRPGPRRTGGHRDQHQQAEAHAERQEQIAICAHQRAIDHPLHEERRQQHKGFQRHGETEDLQQGALEPDGSAQQLPQSERLSFGAGLKVGPRMQFECDTGEVPRDLGQRHAPDAACRVVDHGLAATDLRENDEVVQVPVQHAREFELLQMLHLRANGARVELH